MVPFFLTRMDEMFPRTVTGLSRSITETFRQHVYVTPSGMLDLPHLQFTLDVVGADRIIYAVDYPYLTTQGARSFLEDAPISPADKEKIAHGNAEQLFALCAKCFVLPKAVLPLAALIHSSSSCSRQLLSRHRQFTCSSAGQTHDRQR
jgi:hypothetical protein